MSGCSARFGGADAGGAVAILKYVNEAGEEDLVHVGPDRPKVLIGRSKECDLKTKNNTVSRQHAAVHWRGGRYFLHDLGSANGTFYRRQRVTEVALDDGESVFCGTFQIEFHLDDRDRMPVAGEPGPGSGGQVVEERTIEDEGPPPLPSERIAAEPPRAAGSQAMQARKPLVVPVPEPRSAPETMGRTIGYDTAGRARAEPPPHPDDIEDVTFAVEEEAAPAPGAADAPRRGTAPLEARAEATEVVKFREEASRGGLERILKADREREAREEALKSENQRLQVQIRERDDAIRLLKVQVEELGKVVARYEAASGDRDAELRVADLERVLQATEAERATLEESIEVQKSLVEEARAQAREEAGRAAALAAEVEALRAERDGLSAQVETLEARVAELTLRVEDVTREAEEARQAAEREAASREDVAQAAERISALEGEVEAARSEATAMAGVLKRLETEKAALEEEIQRWEALKRQFEEERTEARVESEGLRKQVAELTARLADASGAAERVAALDGQLKAVTQELSEVKLANRSYLKKISRLLEEAEQARAGAGAAASGEAEALKDENRRLEAEVSRLQADLAAARDQVGRLTDRVSAFESAPRGSERPPPPPPPPSAPEAVEGLDLGAIRAVIARVNDLVSEGRTSLEVVTGLVPELAERVAGTPGVGELVEQIRASADDLAKAIQAVKKEAVQARNLLKEGGR